MLPRLVSAVLLVAAGAAAATWLGSSPPTPAAPPANVATVGGRRQPLTATRDARAAADLASRVHELEQRLADESAERQRLQERLDQVTTQLAALGGAPSAPAAPAAAEAAVPAPAEAVAEQAAPVPQDTPVDYSKSELERGLMAAGLDANTAADVKRQSDSLTMAEMYLRDQASREGWLDTPRFQEELAAIESQRYSIRDELGDDAYDRYLYALGQTNRVRVDDVMSDSPAADAGLQTGDMILRYGETRIFGPDELVSQTRQGTPGELVRVVVIRQGELLTVEVPRGPLGLRIAATQSTPRSG